MNNTELESVYAGRIMEAKSLHDDTVINGVRVGVFTGLLVTWDVDSGGVFGIPDKFAPDAFTESLQEHRERDSRQIRLADHHGRTIGGFPIELARETDVGLEVTGHINLEVRQGFEAFSLLKQGVITDLSVGFITLEDSVTDGVRTILKAILMEGSLVSEPANRAAQITEVKKFEIAQVKNFSARQLERALIDSGKFSQKAAKYIVAEHKEENHLQAILNDLRGIKGVL